MKNLKKWIALAVALCTVIGLCAPLSGTVSAADYQFEDYRVEDLGVAVRDNMSMNNFFEIVTYNGNDYLVCPANGGILFIYDLTAYINGTPNDKGNYIYAEVSLGDSHPHGIVQVGNKVYVTGSAAHVTCYDFASGESSTITLPGTGIGMVADNDGNLFISGNSAVYRIDKDATTSSTIYETSRLKAIHSIVYYNSKLYIQGVLNPTYGDGSEVHEIGLTQSDNGTEEWSWSSFSKVWTYSPMRSLTLEGIDASYYMSCASGMLFFGNVGSLVAVDTTATNLTRYYGRLNADNSVSLVTALAEGETASPQTLGILPVDTSGTSYAVISNIGLYTYNATSKTFVVKTAGGAKSRDLRCRDTYTINGSEFIITGSPSALNTWRLSGTNSFPVELGGADGIFKDGYYVVLPRTMGPGVAGDDTVVYTGGYLSPSVSGYTPSSNSVKTEFSNTHAQTDSILPYGDKLYLGCYSGAYLMEYDPATGTVSDLIPGGVYSDESVSPKQKRIHALAAGDGKIFFATVPDTYDHGGFLGVYDLESDTYKLFAHNELGFDSQILVTLVYDEEANILYAGTSTRGGSDAGFATDADGNALEAMLIAYQFDPDATTFTHLVSTTVGHLTPSDESNPDIPRCIFGIAKDPQGTYWGMVSRTLFTFKLEDGQFVLEEQWSSASYASTDASRYPNSSSSNWFPHQILFDDSYLYAVIGGVGLCRFALNDDRSGFDTENPESFYNAAGETFTSRMYTMGADNNLYIIEGYNINRVVISRTTMMEELIDSYSAGETDMNTVVSAYNLLTENEKSRLGKSYANIMSDLLEQECLYIDSFWEDEVITTLEKAMAEANSGSTIYLLVDYNKDIIVENGHKLDLNGWNVKGNITVEDGALELSGGNVVGAVTAVNGAVTDSTGTGTIKGAVSVAADNPCMPLLVPDSESTYRLFEYTVTNTAVKEDDTIEGAQNFWFDLNFANTEAYTLLKDGKSNLKVTATLTWIENGVENTLPEEIIFDEVVKGWASADHSANEVGLYVQVTGIPAVGVSDITVTPSFEALGTGMKITLDSINHTVDQLTANAITGAYPSDLITE